MKHKRKTSLLLLTALILLVGFINVLPAQKDVSVAVLPFLLNTEEHLGNNYGYNLSKMVTTKLYYSTTADIITMKKVLRELRRFKITNLGNIKEYMLYLIGSNLKADYIVVPTLKKEGELFTIVGSLYETYNRAFINDYSVNDSSFENNVYNAIDEFTEVLFDKILVFNEKQPILHPASINNLDIVLYFDVKDTTLEFKDIKDNFKSLIGSVNEISFGDKKRIGAVFTKKFSGVNKYLVKDFSDLSNTRIDTLYQYYDEITNDSFINSPYDKLDKALKYLKWSTRRNNERIMIGITKNKIGNDFEGIANSIKELNVKLIYFILENSKKDTIEYNNNMAERCNGITIPLSYNIFIPNEYPIRSHFIYKNGSIYKADNKEDSYNITDIFVDKMNTDFELISYDLHVSSLEEAIKFLSKSGYGKVRIEEELFRDVTVKSNIVNTITNSINSLYKKDFDHLKKIVLLNNGLMKDIPIPLSVADRVVKEFSLGDEFYIGANIMLSDSYMNFDFNPFSLIFVRHLNYIPLEIIGKDFIDISYDPEFYSENGIMSNNLWFFKVKLVEIK